MKNNPLVLLAVAVVLLVVGTQSFFTVHQTQKALVLQLGDPIDEIYGPGIHFKLPFIQNVLYFDARILDYDARSTEAFTVDKKAIVLDNYARWRIANPLQFYKTMRTIPGAQARLDDVVYSQLRALVGGYTLTEVVSSHRAQIMEEVTRKVAALMKPFGVEVVDVRIKRTDLPPENQRAIFGRMRAERERQAKQYRSEGVEESTRIRSDADRQRAVELALAAKKSEIIRGEGDALAAKTYADAFGQSIEFFEFQRGLDALRKSLRDNSRVILSHDNPILKPLR
ncbi:MAG: protease modulator HflC [Desulfovibrionaceae bacterium]